jgi:putative redox protein
MSVEHPARYSVSMEWLGDRRFRGGPPGGPALVLDGEQQAGPSPVQALASAIASCSAVDVVEILAKRRTPATHLRVDVSYTRAPVAPRRLTSVALRFIVATDSERAHVERAIVLSLENYCSVSLSLRPEVPITWELELHPAGATPP